MIKKRPTWLIALTAVSTAMCGGALIFYLVYWPKILSRNAALMAHVLDEALGEYHADYQAFPEGPGPRVIAILLGDNATQKSYLRSDLRQFLSAEGEVLDSWKRPFLFDKLPDGRIEVRSAGPNGLFHDEDDLTRDALN